MESLESQVREGLIQKRADEIYKAMQELKYQTMRRDCMEKVLGSMFDALEDDKDLEGNENSEMIKKLVEELFSNPEQLRQGAYQIARGEYMTREQWEAKFEEFYSRLNKSGKFGDEALAKFRKANERFYEFIDHQERIKAGLDEIAKREGVEKALTDEAEYEVTRKIIPTKEGYIAHHLTDFQSAKDYLADTQRAMMMDGEIGQMIGAMCGGMQKALEEMQEINEQTQKDKTLEKAEKIYGI